MHTIREEREITGGGYGRAIYGAGTGKWEVGFYHYGGGWHTAATCNTRDEAVELCCKLNGGVPK